MEISKKFIFIEIWHIKAELQIYYTKSKFYEVKKNSDKGQNAPQIGYSKAKINGCNQIIKKL